MTEREWLECTDSIPMLNFLQGQSTQRKLRLYLCACCRWTWNRNTPKAIKLIIEAAEQFADGIIGKDILRNVGQETEAFRNQNKDPVSWLASWTLSPNAREAADSMERNFHKRERHSHAILLHDLIGNPFGTMKPDAAWLMWNNGTVEKIAQCIYSESAFDRLPILADALEDAGCTDANVLDHLRGPGPHVRGCWPLDLLLGKK